MAPWTHSNANALVWRTHPHGQRQTVGSSLQLEDFIKRKEHTELGRRTPLPLEVYAYQSQRRNIIFVEPRFTSFGQKLKKKSWNCAVFLPGKATHLREQ